MSASVSRASGSNSFAFLRPFMGWWAGELAALIPPALREDPARRRRGLVIQFDNDTIRVEMLQGGRRRELGSLVAMPAAPEAERRAIEDLASRRSLAAAEVGLVAPGLRVLRKSIEFPTSAEADLHAIVSNQIDRLTPYRTGQVRFSLRVVERDRARRRLTVEVVAVATTELEPVLARVRGWNIRPSFLWIEPTGDGAGIAIDLRTKAEVVARHRKPLIPALLAANVLLLAAVVGLPLWDRHGEEARLRQQVVAAKQRADTVVRLRTRIEDLRGELSYLANRQAQAPTMVIALNELTRAIPDGTWIEELRLGLNGLDMRGQSPQASALIGATETIPMFRKVEFRAPVTRDGPLGAERFHISAEYAAGDRP